MGVEIIEVKDREHKDREHRENETQRIRTEYIISIPISILLIFKQLILNPDPEFEEFQKT